MPIKNSELYGVTPEKHHRRLTACRKGACGFFNYVWTVFYCPKLNPAKCFFNRSSSALNQRGAAKGRWASFSVSVKLSEGRKRRMDGVSAPNTSSPLHITTQQRVSVGTYS